MSEQEIYERFVSWLRQGWYGLAEANELMPLVMATCTPEEASLLIDMPFSGKNLEELAEKREMDPVELGKRLDILAKRGLVFRTVRGDTVRYSLNDSLFIYFRSAFWPGRTDERSKVMAPLANQYYYHGFWDPYADTHIKGLRVLPIQETVRDAREILPYEKVAKVLDAQDYFVVSNCPCRHRKNLDPAFPDCEYPVEVCLHFGGLGHYIVENGLGREITRKEAEDILHRCAEVGLVHGVSNYQDGVDTICNCCKCCCLMFEAVHKLKHAEGMNSSNYRVQANSETCIGCGLCVRRCPMEAMQLEDYPEARNRVTVASVKGKDGKVGLKNKSGRVSVVDRDLCIGCGVCAYKCPTMSLVPQCREEEVIEYPPQDGRQHVSLVTADFKAARAQRDTN